MEILRYLVELVGTFLFVYVILNVSNGSKGFTSDPTLGALTICLTLLAVIFAFGHISGGFFNPAISIAKFMENKPNFNSTNLTGYIIAQVIGAILAFKLWQVTTGAISVPRPSLSMR